jgi:hypothetical protein
MRIIEARDGFIKFATKELLPLSSFWQINGMSKRYIAQIIKAKRLENGAVAYAKILFIYDGTLKNYDNTLPSVDASVSEFTFDILNKSLEYTTPIIAGNFISENIDIPIDKSCFNNNMLISADTPACINIILNNLCKQFQNLGNTYIIDMQGNISSSKFVAGKDFKLPLNSESLDFMYSDCLNDATSESKELIKEIFGELGEYSKTVPFVPFATLKSIVDDMVDNSHIFKLLVLKNKLARFNSQGYFAATASDAENLDKIVAQKTVTIDLSHLDMTFQNRYLSIIYSALPKNAQVFLVVSNSINKENIKRIFTTNYIATTLVTHSRFKYINEIKSKFNNFIIEPTFTNNEVFKIYSTFLSAMKKNSYLLVGEGTNYIPLVSNLTEIKTLPDYRLQSQECSQTVEKTDNVEDKNNALELLEEETLEITSEPLESEVSIENQVDEPETLIIDTSTEEAIEKKSDELIEKISESIETPSDDTSLFDSDDEAENKFEEEHQEITNTEKSGNEITEIECINSEETIEPVDMETDDGLEGVSDITEDALDFQPEEDLKENEDFHTEVDTVHLVEVPQDISEIEADFTEIEEDNQQLEEPEPTDNELDNSSTMSEDIILNDTIEADNTEEFVELDPDNSDEDIVIELDDDSSAENLDDESLNKEIVEDVDKVFTTYKDDSISDSDLDFIDELNNEPEILDELETENLPEELPEGFDNGDEEDEILEPIEDFAGNNKEKDTGDILETRNTSTPIVPVYDAEIPQEDIVVSDPIEQGDTVIHAKYGSGIVEKMIKYGTKTLYSINFDNIGRRLLDPTLTEIKKG